MASSSATDTPTAERGFGPITLTPLLGSVLASLRVVEHNIYSYRRLWLILVTGVIEPLLYLLGLGFGMGQLVGDIEYRTQAVSYAAFVAPGLMASSAMNGALFDTTYNFFFKLRESRQYEGMLSTPLTMGGIVGGELLWAMVRGSVYAGFFATTLIVLDLAEPMGALVALPAALLTGWAFGAFGAALTTFARDWTDFDGLELLVQPMFLASTAFFPLSVFPDWAQPLVWATPLFHAVDLIRSLAIGVVDSRDLIHVAYLMTMAVVFTAVTRRRLGRMLLR